VIDGIDGGRSGPLLPPHSSITPIQRRMVLSRIVGGIGARWKRELFPTTAD